MIHTLVNQYGWSSLASCINPYRRHSSAVSCAVVDNVTRREMRDLLTTVCYDRLVTSPPGTASESCVVDVRAQILEAILDSPDPRPIQWVWSWLATRRTGLRPYDLHALHTLTTAMADWIHQLSQSPHNIKIKRIAFR
jgi:hypothetical protein